MKPKLVSAVLRGETLVEARWRIGVEPCDLGPAHAADSGREHRKMPDGFEHIATTGTGRRVSCTCGYVWTPPDDAIMSDSNTDSPPPGAGIRLYISDIMGVRAGDS